MKIAISGSPTYNAEIFYNHLSPITSITPGIFCPEDKEFKIDQSNQVEMLNLEYDTSIMSQDEFLDIYFTFTSANINSFDENCFYPRCRCFILHTGSENEKYNLELFLIKKEKEYTEKNLPFYLKNIPYEQYIKNFTPLPISGQNSYNKNPDIYYYESHIKPRLDCVKEKYPQYWIN